jgi:DNA-binding transcriptional LysR family regulator
MLIEAALCGHGILRISAMKSNDLIQDGQLVKVLEDYEVAGDTAIWALFPSSRHISPKVRVFLDFFAARFRRRQNDGVTLSLLPAAAE